MFERRLRSVSINPQEVLTLFQNWKDRKFLEVRRVSGLPEGCEIVSVTAEHEPHRIVLLVYHPSFEELRPGEMPPPLFGNDLLRTEIVRLERIPCPGSEMKVDCFLVPSGV